MLGFLRRPLFRIVRDDTRIQFMRGRIAGLVVSAVLSTASIALAFYPGLEKGIDFKGGIVMEARTPGPADLGQLRAATAGLGLGDVGIQEFGDASTVLIRLPVQGEEAATQQGVSRVRGALEAAAPGTRLLRTEAVGNRVSDELFQGGLIALGISMLAMLAYIWFRFEWQFAIGAVMGAEALLRWDRPGVGNMPPDRFISVAEETGLIGPIGTWALQEACREAMTWPDRLTIAVNVSPVQFRQAGLFEAVVSALESSGLAPERLEVEITEGVLLSDTDETLATLRRLRSLGVKIAMDDFGTGYSSLGYLQKFPFDKVKIDRSFVRHLGDDRSAEAIVRAVVGMSHALGVHTIAEGVETAVQADMLRQKGCEEVQGYMYGKPMSAEAFTDMLN